MTPPATHSRWVLSRCDKTSPRRAGGPEACEVVRIARAEPQRGSIPQPRVASPRATLGFAAKLNPTLKGLQHGAWWLPKDSTLSGLKILLHHGPRVGAPRANHGLSDAIPLGLSECAATST